MKCTDVNLLDHRVCEILHLLLSFHQILQVYFLTLITDDNKFLVSTADPQANSTQHYVSFLLYCSFCLCINR